MRPHSRSFYPSLTIGIGLGAYVILSSTAQAQPRLEKHPRSTLSTPQTTASPDIAPSSPSGPPLVSDPNAITNVEPANIPPSTPDLAAQPLMTSYTSFAQRLSFGVELGAGANISALAAAQGYVEGYLSLGIDVYNSCFKHSNGSCFRFYVLTPVLGTGYYTQSQLPFFQLGVGPGIQIVFHRWIGFLLEGGVAVKFSAIQSRADQESAGILSLYKRDPNDSILPVGWFQTGISLDLGQKLNSAASKGVHVQAVLRIANSPEPANNAYRTVDLALLLGVRWYFIR